ncbi:DUF721 domain-containing protein [Streptomyces atratus]|uniref:hypothetical protein n=1 Tax=Streptomyces atratus TaxID=1893 RepID=UPI0036479177
MPAVRSGSQWTGSMRPRGVLELRLSSPAYAAQLQLLGGQLAKLLPRAHGDGPGRFCAPARAVSCSPHPRG